MVEKRYQVFVSSTYDDLQEERREAIEGLLKMKCFPCGMEYFNADNDDTWSVIQRLIRGCDYYVVIIAGRYGSLTRDGISYTEKEYQYAEEVGIPIMAFLHKDPGLIRAANTEVSPSLKKKLDTFRDRCKKRMCEFWDSPSDLRAKIISSLVNMQELHPKPGWVRGDHVPDESAAQMMNRLRNENEGFKGEVEGLKAQVEEYRRQAAPTPETPSLSNESMEIKYEYKDHEASRFYQSAWYTNAEVAFPIVAGILATVARESDLAETLANGVNRVCFSGMKEAVKVDPEDLRTFMLHLRKLGLVEKAPSGQPGHWTLTPIGEQQAFKARGIG